MSNVKKGDVAQVKGLPWQLDPLNGQIVIVGDQEPCGSVLGWKVEPQLEFVARGPFSTPGGVRATEGERLKVDGLADKFLRPIRDTGGADEVNAIAQRKSGREVGSPVEHQEQVK